MPQTIFMMGSQAKFCGLLGRVSTLLILFRWALLHVQNFEGGLSILHTIERPTPLSVFDTFPYEKEVSMQ